MRYNFEKLFDEIASLPSAQKGIDFSLKDKRTSAGVSSEIVEEILGSAISPYAVGLSFRCGKVSFSYTDRRYIRLSKNGVSIKFGTSNLIIECPLDRGDTGEGVLNNTANTIRELLEVMKPYEDSM